MTKLLGEIIRQKIREDGRTAKIICEDLGMSRGNLDKIYHKGSINTDLLAKFSLVLGHDFFAYVNPFRKGEAEFDRRFAKFNVVPDDEGLDAANVRLREGLLRLEQAQQELEYLRASVADAKSAHKDKDEIIALMRDKNRFQEEKIAFLESQLGIHAEKGEEAAESV